ncbi:MAG: ComEC/Rec2 family competence protein, partial [Alphaproteobacteria bacterium]
MLANIEFIALRYDIKKISAIFAIFASFVYLKIADAPIPAQRALIMVWLAMFAVLLDKRFNAIRALFFALMILILINPLAIFQVSFLLSFSAVLMIVCYYQSWRIKIFPDANLALEEKFITGFLSKIRLYFIEILFLTFIIQIATLPIIMNNFQTLSIIGFVANLIAIPFVSFIIMPLSFLALILMIFNAQIIPFFFLKFALNFFIKIASYFAHFKF